MAASRSFMLRPLCISISGCHQKLSAFPSTLPSSFESFLSSRSLELTHPREPRPFGAVKLSVFTDNLPFQGQEIGQPQDEIIDEIEEYDAKHGADGKNHSGSADTEVGSTGNTANKPERKRPSNVPNLTVKEKKELASYAHGLGKKLKSQLVGKSGVTQNVASSFLETLEANELLKVKIHRTCPGELEDVVKQLEEATGSVVVGQIGRTVIIYRPSITRMKAEEKKREAKKIFLRRKARATPMSSNNRHVLKQYGRGRRGASRV